MWMYSWSKHPSVTPHSILPPYIVCLEQSSKGLSYTFLLTAIGPLQYAFSAYVIIPQS
jgi:hypothetical protein